MQQDTRLTQKKSAALLYTEDKRAGKEIREITPFTITTNGIIYLRVTLTKQVEDLYDKDFKSLKKEIEEDTRKWKDLSCSWVGRINTVKMAILPKSIYRFNTMPSKILQRPRKNGTQLQLEKQKNPGQSKQLCQVNFWRHHNP